MPSSIFKLVRKINSTLFPRKLPSSIAVYFHALEPHQYDNFEEFVNYFIFNGYHFCNGKEFLSTSSENKIFLSFDDNYKSWYNALDLLDTLNIKGTFFINTLPIRNKSDKQSIEDYYNRICHSGDRTSLSSDEIIEISRKGHTIGCHTHSHSMLTSMDNSTAQHEIIRSKEELGNIIGDKVIHFSYPFGMRRHFNDELRQYCISSGLEYIANAIPCMQYAEQTKSSIHRSHWLLSETLQYNLMNLKTDGRLFESLTGRSAVG